MRTNTKNQDMNELRFAQSYADWRPSGRRLAVALSLSAVFVAMFLSLVTLPHWDWAPAAEDPVFELVIVQPEEAIVPAPGRSADERSKETPDEALRAIEPTVAETAEQTAVSPEDQPRPVIDWYGELEKAAKDRSNYSDSPSMSPKMDELRRVAKLVYDPVKESGPRPIWENIEKDQLGRTLLRAGDFYRVIDDTSVANQWVFRNFSQYIFYYSPQDVVPNELPFVAQVIERRPYLQN